MSRFMIVALVAVLGVATPASAQEDGGGGGGGGGFGGGGGGGQSGLPTSINAPRTIPQQFASKLKLDKTQAPEVDRILTEAATEAAPLGQQMTLDRQRLLNAARANNAAELQAALDDYTAAATKVAGIEGAAFAKVLALLKPNQQKDADQAFALIAGLFSGPSSGAARSGGRGRGGAQ